jgi:phosphopentomutase
MKRVFLIVLDSVGIGALPDAGEYGDKGSNTLKSCWATGGLFLKNLKRLGLYNIDGVDYTEPESSPIAAYARMAEMSRGKDTTIGHWEIAGIITEKPLPTFPDGFPETLIFQYSQRIGRKILCNKPYSGTQVIRDFGREQEQTDGLIVYTSADSVFQIAANEANVPIKQLYEYCEIAREMLQGEYGVGRVIARPYIGSYPNYKRTSNRHDYSISPPRETICDLLQKQGYNTIGIGKISDIFNEKGIEKTLKTKNNHDGMEKAISLLKNDFNGLAFINLVDFDMLYGHRNDINGYSSALNQFDIQLGEFIDEMHSSDILIITADHGCDPGTPSTDHSREHTPCLIYGESIKGGINLGTRSTFADIGSTILDLFDAEGTLDGTSFLKEMT